MALSPKCPEGYKWLPEFGDGKSCFKITDLVVEYNPGSPTTGYRDLTIADLMCLKDQTRLYVPEESQHIEAMSNWINTFASPSEFYYYTGVLPFRDTGPYRKGFILASSNTIVKDVYNRYGDQIGQDTAVYQLPNNIQPTNAKGTDLPYKGICQYTECTSVTGEKCKFPFKYNGRLYDTCITIDDKGLYPGAPWCSSQTDEFGKHIPGKEVTCSSSCRLVDCPVGYYRMITADSCFKVICTRKKSK